MDLQLALDFVTMEEALTLIDRSERFVDIFEVGTPLLLREGTAAVRLIRALHPAARILADAKIVDGGYGEAKMLFDAGADIVTVLAVAPKETLAAVQSAAKECGRTVAADMIASSDPAADLHGVSAAGIEILCVHRAVDSGAWEVENSQVLSEIIASVRTRGDLRVMVAGGVSLQTISSILPLEPDIVVVGGAITGATDPAQAAESLQLVLRRKSV